MVQLDINSNISEHGVASTNPETALPPGDENDSTVSSRKPTALRDFQNNNIVSAQDSAGKSSVKDVGPLPDTNKLLAGTKRAAPESPENPSQHRSPSHNSTNAQLVYVRRKPEVELGKNSSSESVINVNTDNQKQAVTIQHLAAPTPAPTQPISEIKDPKVSSVPAFSPIPMASSAIPSAKPSVPQPVVKSGTRIVAAEPNHRSLASATSAARNLEGLRNMHWEGRYNRLQTLLKTLDQRQQEDYVRLLRSLTAGELSGHAVELEKRAIQLSLEEAKELQRVEALNMLAKSSKSNASIAATRQGRQGK